MPFYADELYLTIKSAEDGNTGDIKSIIKDIKDEHKNKFMILYGTLYTTANCTEQEKKWAKDLGVEYNPLKLEIADGNIKLKCDYDNINELIQNDELIIPSMITEIEQGTFNGINVKRIVIPGSVKTIGANAFSNNPYLEEVIIQEGVKTIGNSAFMNCTKLNTVTMEGDTVTEIGGNAFRSCIKLSNVTISNNIKVLNALVFDTCPLNDKFQLPENLETLDRENLDAATFTTLKLPSKLQTITANGNISKNLIKIDTSDNKYFEFDDDSKVLYNKEKTQLIGALSQITSLNIENSVEKIAFGAFLVCSNLKTVNIPASVKTIDKQIWNDTISTIIVDDTNPNFKSNSNTFLLSKNGETLYRCAATGSVTVPAGVKKILGGAFASSGINSITLPESFETTDGSWGLFPKITTLNLPKNVNSFSKGDYIWVNQITVDSDNPNFEMKDNNYLISKKEDKTLYWVKNDITTVKIPEEVKNITNYAFSNCKNAGKKLEIPEGVAKLDGSYLFQESSFETITLPSTMESISGTAFSAASNITSIVINKSKDSISGAPWGAPGGDKIIDWVN